MITRCDHCGSTFEVSAELVYSNDPGVRCGECLSLFDSRANLYDAKDARKASRDLKSVQMTRRPARADAGHLETADTVAVEHFYTTAGADARVATSAASVASGESGYAAPYPGSNMGSDPAPQYRGDYIYPEDIEFERTVAVESSYPDLRHDGAGSRQSRNENTARGDYPPAYPDDTKEDSTPEQRARRKQQAMRAREQRALQLEPERDFEYTDLESVDEPDAGFVARDAGFAGRDAGYAGRGEPVQRSDEKPRERRPDRHSQSRDQAPGQLHRNNRDRSRDAVRGDHARLPEEVTNTPAVLRDDGRRPDNLQFKPDTPRFETSRGESRSRPRHNAVDRRQELAPDQPRNTRVDESRARAVDREIEQKKPTTTERLKAPERPAGVVKPQSVARDAAIENDRLENGRDTSRRRQQAPPSSEYAIRDDRLVVAGSSAQEMRRYQQHRPAVEVDTLEDEQIDVHAPQGKTRSRARVVTALLWTAGFLLAICLLLFAMRNVIANMNLPAPVISAFCQVSGCVPAEAKSNPEQLQTMLKRLYPHPEIEDALVISVDVVNNSVYKQPYPILAVTLLDAEGESVAERNFATDTYEVVDGGETGFLMPGEPTRIKIEVIDTGLGATEIELTYK